MGNSQGRPVVFTDEGTLPSDKTARLYFTDIALPSPFFPMHAERNLVNLNHFRLLRVVGKGAFGKVRIVERKDSGLTFALKYIRKDEGVWSETSFRELQAD